MIDLKEKDPIEYQLKLSQFKTDVIQQNQAEQKSNQVKCPKCGSTHIQIIILWWCQMCGHGGLEWKNSKSNKLS